MWPLCAWAILLLGTVASIVGALSWRGSVAAQEQENFEALAADVAASVRTQLLRELDLAAAASALVALDPDITYAEITQWAASMEADDRYPEYFGFEFIRSIDAEDLPAYTAAVRQDPQPSGGVFDPAAIMPAGDRPRYCLAHLQVFQSLGELIETQAGLLEHVDWCGIELGQKLRHAARSARPLTIMYPALIDAMGDQITFSLGLDPVVAERTTAHIDEDMARSIFVLAPVYDGGVAPSTYAARQVRLLGWIGAAFDAGMILDRAVANHVGLEVRVQPITVEDDLTVSSRNPVAGADARTMSVAEDGWVITVTGEAGSSTASAEDQALVTLGAGLAVSFLLFTLVRILATSRNRALDLVAEKTGELRHLALHDALTGLPNRTLVLDRAEQALARARREHTNVALLFLDLDNFKDINDTLGHAAGDQLLKAIGARLQAALRETDTVGRIGGDEFVVVAEDPSLGASPELVAERMIEVLQEPYWLGDGNTAYTVNASMGVAVGDRESAQDLLRDADIALYEAKDAGKNCYVVFEHHMQYEVANRLELDHDLRGALESGQFRLVYQPTFGIRDAETTGVEALLRWQHPTRGNVGPMDFIPLLEQNGLIVPVGRWVLQEACRAGAAWHALGHRIQVSVNVSARQLEAGTLADDVADALAQSGFDPAYLVVEITESTLMRDATATVDRLDALKALGVRVAIDDFGTGYSSLAYLRQFPVDILKIDRSFIAGIARSGESAALVHTLIQLGKTLGLETVAEGIEDVAQLDRLQTEDCDTGQGFLHSRPLPPDELLALLDSAMVGTSRRT